MPVSYVILPARDLVLVTCSGFVGFDEAMAAIDAYAKDDGFRLGQRLLIDLSKVTGQEIDFIRFFEMQGQLVEFYGQTGYDQLVGIYAPTDPAKAMALQGLRSWEGVPSIVTMVHQDEAEVLRFLGQPETRIADMLEAVG